MAKTSARETVEGILNVVEEFPTLTVENGETVAKRLLKFLDGKQFSLIATEKGYRRTIAHQALVPLNPRESPAGIRVISSTHDEYHPTLYIAANSGQWFGVRSNVPEAPESAPAVSLPFLVVGEKWPIINGEDAQIALILEES